ncbi:MAG: MoaD/ThiS family protein [Pseudomonadota bacterium]
MAKLLFFGRMSDIEADRDVDLPQGVSDTDALIDWLSADNPVFADMVREKGNSLVVNQAIVRGATPISNADEIAFLSPVSGG